MELQHSSLVAQHDNDAKAIISSNCALCLKRPIAAVYNHPAQTHTRQSLGLLRNGAEGKRVGRDIETNNWKVVKPAKAKRGGAHGVVASSKIMI
jgi:predicted Rossmann fold nucleotide-binding protein DprA/Smf involved in DNA uptake